MGARPVRRVIEQYLEDPLAEKLLQEPEHNKIYLATTEGEGDNEKVVFIEQPLPKTSKANPRSGFRIIAQCKGGSLRPTAALGMNETNVRTLEEGAGIKKMLPAPPSRVRRYFYTSTQSCGRSQASSLALGYYPEPTSWVFTLRDTLNYLTKKY